MACHTKDTDEVYKAFIELNFSHKSEDVNVLKGFTIKSEPGIKLVRGASSGIAYKIIGITRADLDIKYTITRRELFSL